jgi:hypothetical protein
MRDADDGGFGPWAPLPPGSHVTHVSAGRKGAEVVEMRVQGDVVEVATRLGAVVRLGPDTELRLGGWSVGQAWR